MRFAFKRTLLGASTRAHCILVAGSGLLVFNPPRRGNAQLPQQFDIAIAFGINP